MNFIIAMLWSVPLAILVTFHFGFNTTEAILSGMVVGALSVLITDYLL